MECTNELKMRQERTARKIVGDMSMYYALCEIMEKGSGRAFVAAVSTEMEEMCRRLGMCEPMTGESGCEKVQDLDFGAAVRAVKGGQRIARKGWNGKGIYLEVQVPDAHSKMTMPYIYIVTESLVTDNPHAIKGRVPWLASQTDMLAEDWYILEK